MANKPCQSLPPGLTCATACHGPSVEGLQDRRCKRKPDDTEALARIHTVIDDLPTYGYRRVWALLRRQSETDDMAVINAKRVYRIMRQNALLLERKPAIPPSKRAHRGKVAVGESNQRWCSDGFEFSCDNGEKLRVTFALDCCDRAHFTGRQVPVDMTVKPCRTSCWVRERRFGNRLPTSPVEWLTDNGSAYRSHQTRQFARNGRVSQNIRRYVVQKATEWRRAS
ncbi:IS3 family transposase [Escherichia coli]